jgi:hypothetical protein
MLDITIPDLDGVPTILDDVTTGVDPRDGEKKLIQKRAKMNLPLGGKKPAIELAREIGYKLNLDPSMILGSAFGEGFNLMYDNKRQNEKSAAYEYNRMMGNIDDKKHPIDAFYFGGLDNFGPVVKELKQKGYIDPEMDFKIMPVMNEAVEKKFLYKPKVDENGRVVYDKNGKIVVGEYIGPKEIVDRYLNSDKMGDNDFTNAVTDTLNYVKSKGGVINESVAFSSSDDMLKAKAAYLKLFKDKAENYAKNKGVSIPKEDMNYVIMSAYNGGAGAAYDLIDMMAEGKKNISKTGGRRKEVHNNLQNRMRYIDYLSELTETIQ